MPYDEDLTISWVLLTMGDRPELDAAVGSVLTDEAVRSVIVVVNGDGPVEVRDDPRIHIVRPGRNLGVPGGRDLGLRQTDTDLVGFLDDDAILGAHFRHAEVRSRFADDRVGALSLRIVDENGSTTRRHVPRIGSGSGERSGPVATFLGGASILRRSAYDEAGGYWPELFYAHEELDLAWRMAGRRWQVRYEAGAVAFHPRTEVSRHADGWSRTGRNRVMVARRNLPWPVLVVHVLVWLLLGCARAGSARRAYVLGWLSGWRQPVDRRPISWAAVWSLTRLGRPPIL